MTLVTRGNSNDRVTHGGDGAALLPSKYSLRRKRSGRRGPRVRASGAGLASLRAFAHACCRPLDRVRNCVHVWPCVAPFATFGLRVAPQFSQPHNFACLRPSSPLCAWPHHPSHCHRVRCRISVPHGRSALVCSYLWFLDFSDYYLC